MPIFPYKKCLLEHQAFRKPALSCGIIYMDIWKQNISRNEIDSLLKYTDKIGISLARLPKISELNKAQDNNSNDPKGNESPVNFKGLIFIGIACFLIFLAINMKSSTQGTPTSWPDFKELPNARILIGESFQAG